MSMMSRRHLLKRAVLMAAPCVLHPWVVEAVPLYTDNFNRADGALGGSWGVPGGASAMAVVSNAARVGTTTGVDHFSIYSGSSWPNDQYSQIQLTTMNAGGANTNFTLFVRMQTGATSGYAMSFLRGSASQSLDEVTSGTYTNITSATFTVAVNDIFRLEVRGTMLTVKQNGIIRIGPISNTVWSSGVAGFGGYVDPGGNVVADLVLDNWEGGNMIVTRRYPLMY